MNSNLYKILKICLGLLLTALGVKLITASQLTFGGTAGIATIFSYSLPYSWGTIFFVVNLPFFLLSLQQLGVRFTLSSLFSIIGISVLNDLFTLLSIPEFNMLAASIISGLLIGIGITLVLNNGSSLGGIHIFALYLDKKLNLNRGLIIFICDTSVIIIAISVVGWNKALISILSIMIATLIVGRYKRRLPQSETKVQPKLQLSNLKSIQFLMKFFNS